MKPVYLRIVDDLLDKLKSGVLKEGDMLATEQQLQEQYGVSRMTIRKSLAILVEQDLIYRVKGSGTFIKKTKSTRHNALFLNGFYDEVKAQGKTPSTEIISFEMLEPDSVVLSKLNLEQGEKVYHVERLRLIDGEPEMLERTYLPLALFSDLSIDAMRSSKYKYITGKGMKIAQSYKSVMPELPDDHVAKLLKMDQGSPLLKVTSVGELEDGQPFEYSINYFKLNQYSFDFTSRRI